jgi:putative transcriptional regulator
MSKIKAKKKREGLDLIGKCLVATPSLDDTDFERTVILICSHAKDGSMGFIINLKDEGIRLENVLSQLKITAEDNIGEQEVLSGGFIQKSRGFVIHSTDHFPPESVLITDKYALNATVDIMEEIAKGRGPKAFRVYLGFCGWDKGQLEKELKDNSWLISEVTTSLFLGKTTNPNGNMQ